MSLKGIVSGTRIMFGLLPGMGALILLRMAIHLYRPDIEDAENRVRDYPFDELYNCYDFIIVGGGSAGSVLANRLSENPQWTVLLLEAGQDENVLSEIPVLFPVLQTSSIDWQFTTEPSDEYCLSMVDRKCKWPRGKVLGGSSALNAMLYIRGNKRDYDIWQSLGNIGWSYNDVLPYFLKAEDMRIPKYQNDPYHSTGGPLTVEYFNYQQPITNKILEAGIQLGYQIVDVNGEYQTGFTRSHGTVRDGLRCSAAKAYLRPASKRPNLHVSVHTLVEKVLIDEHKRAYGVKFTKYNKQRIIKARREVILSAGAIQSPQLLMLSGVGNAEDLKDLGIYPVHHLPGVGQNLQDHVAMGGHSYLFDNPNKNGSDYCFNMNSVFTLGTLIDFAVHKKGEMYSMMECEAMAFVNTKYQDPSEDFPDIQLFIAPTADNMDGGLFGKRANGLTDETYAVLYEDILYQSSFSIVPLLLRPKSKGYLKLKSSDPFTPPKIYPNYFSHQEDLILMREGARIVQAIVEQPALKELNARPNPNRNPGCSQHELMSDEHLECQARYHSLTIYHPVGTCAMGPVDDEYAVVDSRLRVYGIKNLRVIDGSIMPQIVSGNTNAPIIMIAEKASDMIKQDWSEYYDPLISICPDETYRSSENNNKTNPKGLNTHRPDMFEETRKMFPYLHPDLKMPKSAEEPVHAGSNLHTYIKTKEEENITNNYIEEKKPTATNKPESLINIYNKELSNNNFEKETKGHFNNAESKIRENYPNLIDNTIKEENLFQTPIGPNQYVPVYPEEHYWPLNIFPGQYISPQYYNTPSRRFQSPITRKKSASSVYNYVTKGNVPVKTQSENQKCRIFLYYNGLKYELLL